MTRLGSLLVPVAVLLAACPRTPDPVPPPASPAVQSFTASPGSAQAPGDTVTLTWVTSNATSISIERLGAGPLAVDPGQLEGAVDVAIPFDTVFLLTARGEGGTDSRLLTVPLTGGARVPVFTAIPPELEAGQQATLVWSAPGAKAVSLKEVGGAQLDLGGQVEAGAVNVTPQRTTTYELTVDAATATTTVTVLPAIFDFALVGPAPLPGQPLTLGWRTGGGESLTVSRAGVQAPLTTATGAQVAQGTVMDTAPATLPVDGVLTYTLALSQGARTVTRTLVVRLDGAVRIDAFNVPAYAKIGATYGVSWRTTGATRVELFLDGRLHYVAPDALTAASGSLALPTPAAMATLELVARNDRGGTSRMTKAVTPIGAPTFNAFSADRSAIATGGDAVVLSWDVTNARHVRIVANGADVVFASFGVVDTGTVTVYPNEASVTYELQADNSVGDSIAPRTATVTVGAPATLTFSQVGPVGLVTNVTGTTASATGPLIGLPGVEKNVPGEAFVDIAPTGTAIDWAGNDTVGKIVTLPETFRTIIYGRPIASPTVQLSINGWLVFRSTVASGQDDNAPFPNTLIEPLAVAPFWDDLTDTDASLVYWRLDGEGPGRRLIVQWHEVSHQLYPEAVLTFQAQLYATGKIVFAYRKLQGLELNEPSVGVTSPDESDAVVAPGFPAEGDTFTFFGPQQPPIAVKVDGQPLVAYVALGGGFMKVEGNPFSVVVPDAGQPDAGTGSDAGVTCGNGALDPGEGCDDGASADGDGCSAGCAIETGYTCTGAPSMCRPACGDGLVLAPETCDDNNLTPLDGCSASCTVEMGYTCVSAPSLCRPICGDGVVMPNEPCDDGNMTPGDGCSGCRVAKGYACEGSPSVCAQVGTVTSVSLDGLSSDTGHGCLGTSNGSVWCWGANTTGQLGNGTSGVATMRVSPGQVGGLTNVVQVTAGSNFNCARRTDGSVACWGNNGQLQCGAAGTASKLTPVEAGGVLTALDIEAGDQFVCARLTNATVACWGDGADRQLARGTTTTDSSAALAIPGVANSIDLGVGASHACSADLTGSVLCWGDNDNGQIGIGDAGTDIGAPTAPLGLPPIASLCGGENHTCAVTQGPSPQLYCWGDNVDGQLGIGNFVDQPAPVLVPGVTPSQVACGAFHTCAIETTGDVKCWGNNDDAQLGDGTTQTRSTPVPVTGLPPSPVALALGFEASCALYANGDRWCWGQSEDGQLGIGVPVRTAELTSVNGIANVARLATTIGTFRFGHACAVTGSHDLSCWGENQFGQLGDGTVVARAYAAPVVGLAGAVLDVATSRGGSTFDAPSASCAVLTDGGVQCWGNNNEGQLGDGTDAGHLVPQPAAVSVAATGITTGVDFFCTTHADQEVRCWGNNSSGQQGAPPATPRFFFPRVVPGLTGAVEVAAGADHLCARMSDGSVACVGENGDGQLGNNSTTDSSVVLPVAGVSNAQQICSGFGHTCAIVAGGALVCWGRNDYGQMANGTSGASTDVRVPTVVAGVSGATWLSCGNNYTCVVVGGGRVQCMGYGLDGQLGNGGNTNHVLSAVFMSDVLGASQVIGANSGTFVVAAGSGAVRALGFTGFGQLGTGATLRPTLPVLVQPF